jgi:hypothetical protein
MPSASEINLERPGMARRHPYADQIIRCINIGCKEPDNGVWVSTPTTLYIGSSGQLQDQADMEWSDHDTAGCSCCDEQGQYSDFTFYPGDFLLYPRDLKDLEPKKKKEEK